MRKHLAAVIAVCLVFNCLSLSGQELHPEEFVPRLILPIGHTNAINTVELSSDDRYLVSSSYDKTAKVWSARSGVELFTLNGHSATVNTASFSDDKKYIVTSSSDRTARIWSVRSAKEVHILEGHRGSVKTAKFSPDGQHVVTSSFDSTARIWSVSTGELTYTLSGHKGKLSGAAFSPDGQHVVTSGFDSTARIWSAATGEPMHILTGHKAQVLGAAFSPDGEHVVTSSFDSTARIWSVSTGELKDILFEEAGPVKEARFTPDGKQIVTLSFDKTVRVWSVSSGSETELIEYDKKINSFSFSSDGQKLVTAGTDGNARLWDLNTGNLIRKFEGFSGWISLQNISPNSKTIVTTEFDGSTKVWSVPTGEELFKLKGHTGVLNAGDFSRDGNLLLTAGGDKDARLWSMKTGEELFVLKGHAYNITSASFSPRGEQILTTSLDGSVKTWSVETGEEIHSLVGHLGKVNIGQFSPDGEIVLTAGNDRTIKLWSAKKGKNVRTLTGHNDEITVAKFSPDGSLIVSVSDDKTLIVWSTDTGEPQYSLTDFTSSIIDVQISPDGQYLLTATSGGIIKIWSFGSSSEILSFSSGTNNLKSVSFSPERKDILTLSDENTIKIWDSSSGDLKFTFTSQSFWLNQAKYSPDGKYIITTGGNGSITYYDSKSGEKIISKIVLKDDNWININSKGLFDASPKAMEWMHYTVGLEVIELEQLKERYYYPGLYKEQMSNGYLNLPDVSDFYSLEMYPRVSSSLRGDSLVIHLQERNGGIGKVSLFINEKEVVSDLNPERKADIQVDLKQFSKHYIKGPKPTVNKVSIRAFNSAGWLKSSFKEFDYIIPPEENEFGGIKLKIKYSPKFYGIIVGTADYNGTELDLKYADKDAEYIYISISQASEKLFDNNTSIYYLGTSSDTISPRNDNDVILTATKENIRSAFEMISKEADPRDILFMYFAGHGVSYGGSENDQFYYLTKDCTTGEISDPVVRENFTISTEEFTQWIADIPARKQVMIIDACSSGKIIEDLTITRDVPTSQIRALDRLKDRTGMFVITGSAAEKVSYESSQFGQGLLTYTLLEGMSGEALMDRQVDVSQLFNFARDKVPQYAEDLGASQKPILFAPQEASSFPIGIVTDSVEIPMEQVKPVFIRTILLDEDYGDPVRLSQKMDDYLDAISYNFSHELVFVDVKNRKNAYEIRGGYSVKSDNKINISGRLYFNNEKLNQFSIKGSLENEEILIEEIMFEVSKIVNQHKSGSL